MEKNSTSHTENYDETELLLETHVVTAFDLVRVTAALRQHWLRWFAITLGSGILGSAIALLIPPTYRAEAVLTVVPDTGKSGQGALGQVSGLADLAGISLPASNNRSEALATLVSRALIMRYIEEKNLLPILFENKWDAKNAKWENPDKAPTLWNGWNYFLNKLYEVKEDKKNGTITVAVEWTSAELAATWVNDLVAHTNAHIRERTIQASEKNLQYLQGQLAETSMVEMQQAIYRLMENELKQTMVAKGTEEYILRVIDPAFPPGKKNWPNIPLFVFLSLLFGAVLGLISVQSLPRQLSNR